MERTTRRIGAWIGALALFASVLAATPATGQVSPIRFDPDAAEQRFRVLPGQFETLRLDGSTRPMLSERSGVKAQLSPGRLEARPGFFKEHLLPRMSRQVAFVPSIHALETQHGRFEHSGMHDWLSDRVARRATRATRKAVRAYLLEETAIGSWFESQRVGAQRFARPTVARATDFGIDIAHGIPKAGMRHRSAVGTARFSVGLDGSVRLDFQPARWISAQFYAGYEVELSRYRLTYRLDF